MSNLDRHDITAVCGQTPDVLNDDLDKAAVQHAELTGDERKPEQPALLKSSLDNVPVWKAALLFKRVAFIAMLAAFSASLDGYQINLNGSIIVNIGFVRELFGEGYTNSPSQYVSAWGGIQSVGQAVGQLGLPFLSDRFGRKMALYGLWLILALSVAIETGVHHWYEWLIAKFFAGLGVGMLQATLPLYIMELAPNQLRGALVNAYSFWFVVGQLMAPVALQRINALHPTDFRIAIYTQWPMLAIMLVIFFFLPESPWWLVSHGKSPQAKKVLLSCFGHVDGYDVDEHVGIMAGTIEHERLSRADGQMVAVRDLFRGVDGWRMLIALWPKLIQTFVGLTIFNTYATYFFKLAGNKDPFRVTVILSCCQLIAVLVVFMLTDSYGRRPLTIYPYCVTVVAVLGLGIIGCFDYTKPALGSLLVFFACLATFTTTAASAIGYAYITEIPAQRMRAKTAGWGLALPNIVFGIMFSFVVPIMLKGPHNQGGWGVKTAFFFAGTGTIVCIIGFFILPEVARRSPAEIDEMFEKGVKPRQFRSYVTEVQIRLEEEERARSAASVV